MTVDDKLLAVLSRIAIALEEQNQIEQRLVEAIEANTSAKGKSQPENPKRATLAEAKPLLGLSYHALYNRIKQGRYRMGYEVFDMSDDNGKNQVLRLDIDACIERDKQISKKRSQG